MIYADVAAARSTSVATDPRVRFLFTLRANVSNVYRFKPWKIRPRGLGDVGDIQSLGALSSMTFEPQSAPKSSKQ
jgi:hypothetical protein